MRTKAIAYCRTASNSKTKNSNQVTGHGQYYLAQDYAEANNIKLERIFDSCSNRYAKNELEAALNFCKLHPKVKLMLVSNFDRISRDAEDCLRWVKEFSDIGVEIRPLTYSFSENVSTIFLRVLSELNKTRSEYIKRGNQHKRLERTNKA